MNAVRPVAPDATEDQWQQMTFHEWLQWHLTHPSTERERGYLISDEKYCLLLSYATVQHHTRKVDYIQQNKLTKEQRGFLYHATGDNTYRYQLMQYTPGPVADIDLGAVLWCFKKPAKKAGGKSVRKKPADDTPTTTNLGRRCAVQSDRSTLR